MNGETAISLEGFNDLGVSAMNQGLTEATHTLIIERRDTEGTSGVEFEDTAGSFTLEPYAKSIPYAMWNNKMLDTSSKQSINQDRLIENTVGGFTLKPATPVTPGEGDDFDRSQFAFETDYGNGFSWCDTDAFNPATDAGHNPDPNDPVANLQVLAALQQEISSEGTQANRQMILNALGFVTDKPNLNQPLMQYTSFAPQYGNFAAAAITP
ncbi:MAG: hypothetical protein R3E95_01435 [Thiolinea sp.]